MGSYLCRTVFVLAVTVQAAFADSSPVRVGWVGGMTGPTAKYGAHQAAILAMEDVNRAGGIGGRKLELIFEDGKGEGRTAVKAALKILKADRVPIIIGGHCTPESLPMAAVVDREDAVMLAAITSSPRLSGISPHVFRVTAVSLQGAKVLADYLVERTDKKSCAVLYEITDYAQPLAEGFRDFLGERGGAVPLIEGVSVGTSDFRPLLLRMKQQRLDCLYLGVQSPETATLVLQQARELDYRPLVLGNEITGNAVSTVPERSDLFEGLVFAEPEFDTDAPRTAAFIERFKTRFGVGHLPYGFWSAEAYDAVRLMAYVIARCGERPSAVRKCLRETDGFEGMSGRVSIDERGDGVRQYSLKRVMGGAAGEISPSSTR